MFYKYMFSKNISELIKSTDVISFGYTALTDEPSLIHSHPYSEVIIPLNNYGKLVYNDEEENCATGKIYLICPNVPHTEKGNFEAKTAEDYHCFRYFSIKLNCVIFHPDKSEDLIVLSKRETYDELADYLLKAYKNITEYKNEEVCELNLSCFYYSLVMRLKNEGYSAGKEAAPRRSGITQELEYYISKNYNVEINIDDFATQYGIHRNTLTRKFKKETGVTPKDYLLATRIRSGEHLLLSTDYTVSQIASMCGFASHAYFSHLFKKRNGLTPQEYREKYFKKD